MHPCLARRRLILSPLLALLALNVVGCQSTRPADQKTSPRSNPIPTPRRGRTTAPAKGGFLLAG